LDLELRGPGEIYGARQHGVLDLRIAKLSDTELISAARKAAEKCIQEGLNLLQYPRLARRVNELRKVTNLN
jgi:ATP-dependent DNA helicase RecG